MDQTCATRWRQTGREATRITVGMRQQWECSRVLHAATLSGHKLVGRTPPRDPPSLRPAVALRGTPHKHYAAHTKLGAGEASAVWWVERYAPFCLAICDTSLVACCWPAENTLDTAFLSTRRRSPKSQTDRARRILPVTSWGRLRKAQITTRIRRPDWVGWTATADPWRHNAHATMACSWACLCLLHRGST